MPEPGSNAAHLNTLRRNVKILQNHEAERRKQAWEVYDQGIDGYERTFTPIFETDRGEIANFARERREHTKPFLAFDVMGNGRILRDLQPTAGLAVTLTDLRTLADRQDYATEHITLLAGDIYERETWQQVHEWLNNQQTPDRHFHLIMERGAAGLLGFPNNPRLGQYFVENLWRVLSADHGRMYLQIPFELDQTTLLAWVERLNQEPGIQARCAMTSDELKKPTPHPSAQRSEKPAYIFPLLRLDKLPNAPERLPRF